MVVHFGEIPFNQTFCSILESQRCHLILLSYLLCFFLPSPLALSVLLFFCYWSILVPFYPRKLKYFSLKVRLFSMALVERLRIKAGRCRYILLPYGTGICNYAFI